MVHAFNPTNTMITRFLYLAIVELVVTLLGPLLDPNGPTQVFK